MPHIDTSPRETEPTGQSSPAPTPPPDRQDATVGRHLACWQCGYDLHGLPRSSVCPECGMRVATSLQVAGPDGVDGRWAAQMARGARLLWVGLAGGFVLPVMILAVWITGVLMWLWDNPTVVIGAWLAMTAAYPLTAGAGFCFTASAPRGPMALKLNRPAELTRMVSLAALLFCALAMLLILVLVLHSGDDTLFAVLLHLVPLASGLALLMLGRHAAKLAHALGHPAVGWVAHAAQWLGGLSMIVVAPMAAASVALSQAQQRPSMPWQGWAVFAMAAALGLMLLTACISLASAAYLLDRRLRRLRLR